MRTLIAGASVGLRPRQIAVLWPPEDADRDGLLDPADNSPIVFNPGQADADADGVGDACNGEIDFDGDEFADELDNCPDLSNPDQSDRDGDGIGDLCDNFPDLCDDAVALADQLDICRSDLTRCEARLEQTVCGSALLDCEISLFDTQAQLMTTTDALAARDAQIQSLQATVQKLQDQLADAELALDTCVADLDGDGSPDAHDNCPWVHNPDQADGDQDGIGDACGCGDVTGDGVVNSLDARLIQRLAVRIFEPVNMRCAARLGP